MTEATKKSNRARSSRKGNAAPELSHESNKPEITLADIVAATLDESRGFLYTNLQQHGQLEQAGLVEVNESMIDANGDLATRATQAGIEAVKNAEKAVDTKQTEQVESVSTVEQKQSQPQVNQTAVPETKEVKKMSFAIETVDIPAVKRGRGAASQYPFDALEVGQSFFVPDAGDKKAAKTIASSVSAANVRHSRVIEGEHRINRKGKTVPKTEQLREFATRSVEKDPTHGVAGVRVVRTK